MGKRKALKGDGETLKNDRAALNGSKEVLKGVEELKGEELKGDKKGFKGCWRRVKGQWGIIVLLDLYTCQSVYFPVYFI